MIDGRQINLVYNHYKSAEMYRKLKHSLESQIIDFDSYFIEL